MSMTTLVPLFIGGMLLAAASAFIVTTGTSYLLSSATSITYDFYTRYFNHNPSDKQTLFVTRYATPVVGVLAYVILQYFPSILAVQSWSYTMIGASLTPPVLGALLSKKVTPMAGLLSMIVGALGTLGWELAGKPGGVASALIAFPAAVIVLVVVSMFTQKREA
jgi:SSS family solute:Na+ symporter